VNASLTAPDCPTLLLVGGAGAIPLGVDVARLALSQARARGLATEQTNQADTLVATPDVAALADASWAVDFMVPGASGDWARCQVSSGRRIDLVIGVRELAQEAAAEVAAAVGAPGNPPSAVHTVRNKDLCRAALAGAGFRQPAVWLCADPAAAEIVLSVGTGPWVIKPRDAMGSEGVRRIESRSELAAAVAALPSPDSSFLIEEFVTGEEFSVEGVFLGGQPRVLAVTEKQLATPRCFVETGHVLPARVSAERRDLYAGQAASALTALGLKYGVFHVELWDTPDGVVLGEVHVRNGGDWIHLMLQYVCPGLDLFGVVFDDALGRPVEEGALTPRRGAAVRFLVPPPGVVEQVDGWAAAAAHPAVLHARLDALPGCMVGPLRDSQDRVGEIVVGADTAAEAAMLADALAGSVTFTVRPAGVPEPVGVGAR